MAVAVPFEFGVSKEATMPVHNPLDVFFLKLNGMDGRYQFRLNYTWNEELVGKVVSWCTSLRMCKVILYGLGALEVHSFWTPNRYWHVTLQGDPPTPFPSTLGGSGMATKPLMPYGSGVRSSQRWKNFQHRAAFQTSKPGEEIDGGSWHVDVDDQIHIFSKSSGIKWKN